MTTALTRPEKSVLAECEAVIERGMDSFIEVGNALLRIRNERLYRSDFGTFQEYCEARWSMSKTHANRMIDAAEVAENLTPMGVKPTSERQLRPLVALPPVKQREAWKSAVETSATGQPTSTEVAAAALPRPERINYRPSNGLQYAAMAIANLEKIQPNDTERAAALEKVSAWIRNNQNK